MAPLRDFMPVSYTHLDVYKRQSFNNRMAHLLAQAIKCKIYLLIMSDTFWSKEFWTTNSPDLNAVHYYVWGIIESVSNKPRHPIGQPFRLVLMQH